jgi:MSHA pilin protein MshB
MKAIKNQSGFTLIELVITIVILGVLATTALPQFINLGDDAIKSTVQSTAGSFKTSLNLVRMKYVAAGYYRTAVPDFLLLDNVSLHALTVNKYGYPVNTSGNPNGISSNDDCVNIFRGLLDTDYTISTNILSGSDYVGKLSSAQECSYRLSDNESWGFDYDSALGDITTVLNDGSIAAN